MECDSKRNELISRDDHGVFTLKYSRFEAFKLLFMYPFHTLITRPDYTWAEVYGKCMLCIECDSKRNTFLLQIFMGYLLKKKKSRSEAF